LNPIFKRELLTRLRDPRMIWAAAAFMLAPFAAVAWMWPKGDPYAGGATGYDAVLAFFVTQAILILIVVPVLGAFAINTERNNRTYDALLTTLMPAWTIGLSKLAAIVVLGAVLMAASLPALSLVFHIGGIEGSMILLYTGLMITESAFIGIMSLIFSAIFRRGFLALIASYVALIPLFFIDAPEEFALVFYICGSLLLVPVLIYVTRQPAEEQRFSRPRIIGDPAVLRERRRRWPYYITDPARRPDPIPDHLNPLIMKEEMTHPVFRSAWRWRSLYVMAILVFVTFLVVLYNDLFFETNPAAVQLSSLGTLWVWPSWLRLTAGELWMLAILLIPLLLWTILIHALAFRGEQEGRTLEMLKLTALRPRDFLAGKWKACWRLRYPALIFSFGFLFLYSLSGPGSAVKVVLLTFLCIELVALATILAALVARTLMQTFLRLGLHLLILLACIPTGAFAGSILGCPAPAAALDAVTSCFGLDFCFRDRVYSDRESLIFIDRIADNSLDWHGMYMPTPPMNGQDLAPALPARDLIHLGRAFVSSWPDAALLGAGVALLGCAIGFLWSMVRRANRLWYGEV